MTDWWVNQLGKRVINYGHLKKRAYIQKKAQEMGVSYTWYRYHGKFPHMGTGIM
jgi:hypothetical protein